MTPTSWCRQQEPKLAARAPCTSCKLGSGRSHSLRFGSGVFFRDGKNDLGATEQITTWTERRGAGYRQVFSHPSMAQHLLRGSTDAALSGRRWPHSQAPVCLSVHLSVCPSLPQTTADTWGCRGGCRASQKLSWSLPLKTKGM